jgi:hypothetical protein
MNTLFKRALKNGFDMTNEDADALARTINKAFHGRKEVEDMSLDKHVRSLFYELHQMHFLSLRREEVKENGKCIRKFYWSFDSDGIKGGAKRKLILEEPYAVYERIPRDAWLIHSQNT